MILREAASFNDTAKHAVTYGVMKSIVGIDRDNTVTQSNIPLALVHVVNTGKAPANHGCMPNNHRSEDRKPKDRKDDSSSSSSEEDERACWKCGNLGQIFVQCKLNNHLCKKAKRDARHEEKQAGDGYKKDLSDSRRNKPHGSRGLETG